MPKIFEKEYTTSKAVQRIIGHIKGNSQGPTVIFFAGIHGNEPAGVEALAKVFANLQNDGTEIFGQCYGIAGNLAALKKGVRFLEEDLNRIWFPYRLKGRDESLNVLSRDEKEMMTLHRLIQDIIATASPPFYFMDLHTTSGETEPFIVVNDSLLNRKFTSNYPLPVILGIEEYLTGALLSHINEMGYVAFGFESGQHGDIAAVTNAENFIWYTLGLTGFYPMDAFHLNRIKAKLELTGEAPDRFYEICYQHLISDNARFKMLPGFANFQTVPKGVAIAMNGNGVITTKKRRQLFMPLYQDKGYEGFYFIRSIPHFFLLLSKFLRKLQIDGLLARLPGVTWSSSKKDVLYLDKRIARFFAKSFFHLLGYRAREMDKNHLVLKNRERNSKNGEYKNVDWL